MKEGPTAKWMKALRNHLGGTLSASPVVLVTVAFAFGRPAVAAEGMPTLPGAVEEALRQRVEYGYNPGIVVGLVNREGRLVRGYGRRSLWLEGAPDGRTLFEIGSITKLFTAALLADAVVRGEVGLDDTAQSLFPATVRIPRRNAAINLRHLATHRSGLPTIPDNLPSTRIREPFAGYDAARLDEFLGRYVPPREPGAAWEYSNLGFGLLGRALAQRAGRDYEALLQERILDPLGLTSTRGTPEPEQVERTAMGFSGVVPVPPFRMPALEGAGVLRSSAEDLLTFLEYQMGLREAPILSAAVRETQQVQGPTTTPGVSIGLGWLVTSLPGGRVFQHDGETPGFTAFLGFHPERGVGVVLLSNARINARSGLADVGFHLLDPSYRLASIPRPPTVEASSLVAFPGIYRSPAGDAFELGLSGDRLVLYHVRSDFEFTLYPQSNTRFQGLDLELGTGASAQLRSDSSGVVTGLDWTQQGTTLRYLRVGDPARLQLARDADGFLVSISGGHDASYRIEGSTDQRQWEALGIVRDGSAPLRDFGGDPRATRFYRAVRLRPRIPRIRSRTRCCRAVGRQE